MFAVNVSHGALRALTLIAPDNEARTCLNNICVDTTTPGRVHLVACDGHRILIVNAAHAGDIYPAQFLIPVDAFKGLKQRGTERYPQPITIDIEPERIDGRGTYAIHSKATTAGMCGEGPYAPWQRVVPRKTSGKLAQYNLGYAGDFGRVAELLGYKYPAIRHNGDSAALIELGPDAFGVLMPIRKVEPCESPPDWLDSPKAEEQKAA